MVVRNKIIVCHSTGYFFVSRALQVLSYLFLNDPVAHLVLAFITSP